MTIVAPNPQSFSITYSVWYGANFNYSVINTEVKAPTLTEAIHALRQSFETQGFPIHIITTGGKDD